LHLTRFTLAPPDGPPDPSILLLGLFSPQTNSSRSAAHGFGCCPRSFSLFRRPRFWEGTSYTGQMGGPRALMDSVGEGMRPLLRRLDCSSSMYIRQSTCNNDSLDPFRTRHLAVSGPSRDNEIPKLSPTSQPGAPSEASRP
ncbi:hypothetical protein RTBOTA2_000993, partial [Rhodotorula toruloides]